MGFDCVKSEKSAEKKEIVHNRNPYHFAAPICLSMSEKSISRGSRCLTVETDPPPPYWRERNKVTSDFLESAFGNSLINVDKYKYNKWYNYWNSYARWDCERSPTLEKRCFGCKEVLDTSDNIPRVCGVSGCPKVMHERCWNFFHQVKENHAVRDEYFKFMNKDVITSAGLLCSFIDRNDASFVPNCGSICPRHICNHCNKFSAEMMSYCPMCPAAYCKECIGFECETLCGVCGSIPDAMNAPEMTKRKFFSY